MDLALVMDAAEQLPRPQHLQRLVLYYLGHTLILIPIAMERQFQEH